MISLMDLLTSLIVVLAFGLVLPPALKETSKFQIVLLLLLGLTILANAFSGIEWFKHAAGLWAHPDQFTRTATVNVNKISRPLLSIVWIALLVLLLRKQSK